jgi:hypothetical protein
VLLTPLNNISVMMIPHIMPPLHCRQYPDFHAQNTLRMCIADMLTEHIRLFNDHQEMACKAVFKLQAFVSSIKENISYCWNIKNFLKQIYIGIKITQH